MAERFLIRTEGGPNPGTRVAENWLWPLPVLLLAEGGSYVKTTESKIPPVGEGSGLLRGAEYRWQPGGATADQLAEAIACEIGAVRLEEAVGLLHLLALADPRRAQGIYDTLTAVALTEAPDA